ncbi:MAG: hypothetical protein Q8P67_15855 [archaeon]|nr:hypothetical protein [archaeon]
MAAAPPNCLRHWFIIGRSTCILLPRRALLIPPPEVDGNQTLPSSTSVSANGASTTRPTATSTRLPSPHPTPPRSDSSLPTLPALSLRASDLPPQTPILSALLTPAPTAPLIEAPLYILLQLLVLSVLILTHH